jgi:hypothetical protein
MAERRTVQELIAAVAEPGESLRDWCARVDYPERTLFRVMTGSNDPRMGTLTLLAGKLGVDLPTLRAAIKASRAGRE